MWLLARRRGVGCDLEELECEAKRAANPEFEQRICGLVKSISQEIGPLKQQEFARKRGAMENVVVQFGVVLASRRAA